MRPEEIRQRAKEATAAACRAAMESELYAEIMDEVAAAEQRNVSAIAVSSDRIPPDAAFGLQALELALRAEGYHVERRSDYRNGIDLLIGW